MSEAPELDRVLIYNSLTGPIHDSIFLLTQLTYLDLYKNQLSGPIPAGISNLAKLKSLYLNRNDINGSVPTAIASLTNLQDLSLAGNQLSGSIPAAIGNLKNLERLYLGGNHLTGSIPAAISNLTRLMALDLAGNQLIGTISAEIASLPNLHQLSLQDNQLTGSIPAEICNLQYMKLLSLGGNQITGSIPAALQNISYLAHLDLGYNQLSGSIPTAIGNLQYLTYLFLESCQLSGTIPDPLSSLTSLQFMDLARNNLMGPIPTFVSKLTRLMLLYLYQNELEGAIPESIYSISSLQFLDLSMNKLTGPISPSIGQLPKLRALILHSNHLSGAIPDAIGKLTSLEYLSLAYNQLYGSLPAILASMTQLTMWCDFSHNYLTGSMVQLPSFFADYSSNYLTGFLGRFDCPDRRNSVNCFKVHKDCRFLGTQRPAAECQAFCGIFGTSAACGGHGTCYPDGPSLVPTCLCQPGFVQHGKIACAAEGWNRSFSINKPILSPYTLLTKGSQRETVGRFMAKPVTLFAYPGGPSLGCGVELAFSVNFTFALVPESGTVGSNGFAFVIAAKAMVGKPDGVGYGGVGTQSVAVEFDTLQNAKHSDTSGQHVGLNIKGMEESLVSVESPFSLTDINEYTAWVDYEPGNHGTIKVFLADSKAKPQVPLLQRELSLCSVLEASAQQQAFFFGFVASTIVKPFQMHVIVRSGVQTAVPPTTTVQIKGKALGLSLSEATFSAPRASPFSRYMSAGFSVAANTQDSWVIRDFHSWGSVPFLGWPVKNQIDCNASWAYAVVASVEAAYGIARQQSAPQLSVEALFAAMGLTDTNKCTAGCSPTEAFEKLVTLDGSSGLTGVSDPETKYPVQAYERSQFKGYVGLMQAVQRQPVVVHIEASADTFVSYDGTFKYQDPGCYTGNLNHVVLIIGFFIDRNDGRQNRILFPFWIIRNSWGVDWGDRGHMRMDIQAGDGVCGINVLPGIYPIVKIPGDPCGTTSYQRSMTPCGRFLCQKTTDNKNNCSCSISGVATQPFVEVDNGYGSSTCAYVDVCGSSFSNPCYVGTCINDGKGAYSCICPPNYIESKTVYDFPACDPANTTATTITVSGDNWWCLDVCQLVGLSLNQLTIQNEAVDCRQPLPKATVLQLDGILATPCTAFFYTLNGDTCSSITKQLNLTSADFAALNPGFDCSKPIKAGRSVCIERNAALAFTVPECVRYGVLTPQDTCKQLFRRTAVFKENPLPELFGNPWVEFFRNNPGLTCSSTIPSSVSVVGSKIGVQVCLRAEYWSFKFGMCNKGRLKKVSPAMTCSAAYRFYGGNTATASLEFNKYNGNFCVGTIKSKSICVP